jgi:predicted ATPase/DNA-binding SARP family transcriptional activator
MDTRKAVAMLAYLALTAERQSRDSLAAFLWPDYDDRRGKAALRRTLSTLKSAVGDDCLTITRESIGMQPDSYWCDVLQFQQYISAELWEQAIALCRDDFLAGFFLRDSISFDDWQVTQAEALRRDMVDVLEALSRKQQAAGDFAAAIRNSHTWLQMDPLREDAHRQLMLLYAQSGQRNKALDQFRNCVRILNEELGVSPLPETAALHDAIRDNQISALSSTHDSPLLIRSAGILPDSLRITHNSPPTTPLIGRDNELRQMLEAYQQTKPDGRLLTIEGETGIGKTRLAEAFLASRQLEMSTVLFSRCYEGENNLAYAPIIQILRDGLRQPQAAANLSAVSAHALAEAGRLLPELLEWQDNPLPSANLEAPGAQNRFYEGIGQVLTALVKGQNSGVLWLDDAHWFDSASLDLLLFLLRRWSGRPYLILLCWRTEFLPANHPLYGLAADLRRAGVSEHLQLTRFTLQEVRQLLAAVMPERSPDLPDKLYHETEGLPYFVVEYLNALRQQESLAGSELSWDIPHTVRDLLNARLVQLDETERQLLQTAAAIGHSFVYDLLHLASGRSDDETVSSLETLVARGLLVERKAGYDFSHAKLSQLAYAAMGLARRRLLHRRIAEALVQSIHRQSQSMAVLAEIANHYRLAGLDEEACHYFVQAGDQARKLFAHQEGVYYYQSALALGFEDAWKLHEANADMYVRLGDYNAALSSYETAASLAETAELGRLEHKLGQVYIRKGSWLQAEAQLALAKERINQADNLARLFIDWSYVAFNLKEIAQAQEYAEQGRQMAGTPQVQAEGENISGLLTRHEGAYERAVVHFQRSLTLARTHHLPDTEIAALNNLALTESARRQAGVAQEHFFAALALCQTYGDRHREAALHNNLADLLHQMGDEDGAMAELKTAVTIYAEIGGQPGSWQPEIWKLTEW